MTIPHMIYNFAWAACGLFGCFLVLNVFMRRPSARPIIIFLLAMVCLCFVFFAHGQAVRTTYPDRSAAVKPKNSFVPKPKHRKRRRNEFEAQPHLHYEVDGWHLRRGDTDQRVNPIYPEADGGFSAPLRFKVDGGVGIPQSLPYQQPLDVILAHYGFCMDGSRIPASVPESESQIERHM